ncbi:5'-nucleotidase C-terminal domain-containing protein [Lederbergia citri]|nr:5'-nucleotidase C-terminal domain-containing protein [Lederbergia citri]
MVSAAELTPGSGEDLIISEYIEGSSFNKAIELYNATGTDVDLSQYTLELYSNGASAVSQNLTLSGTLANGETYVLYHGQASEEIKSKGDLANSTVINFNGDDAIVLKKGSTVVDSVGQVGERVNNLADVTLVRNSNITVGDKNPNDPFDPSVEWTNLGKDIFTNLGLHTIDGSNSGEPDPDPEEPVEAITIAEARSQGTGEAKVKGIVTAKLKNTIHIQDETAAIAVRPTSLEVQIGDEITVSGSLQEFRGLLQLDSATLVEKSENVVPEPVELQGEEINEENESKLAVVNNIELVDVNQGNGWANYTAKAENGTQFLVRDETGTLELAVGTTYDSITGIVQQFDNDYQIIPRGQADIVVDASAVQPVTASPTPGLVPAGTKVSLNTTTKDATIYYTTDGTEPTEESKVYVEPITIDKEISIKAIAVKEGLTPSKVNTFVYTTYNVEEGIKIHHIQGESHESPMVGQFVENVEGIVTYIYKLGGNNYFHMQTPDDKKDNNPKTSEGIVVFTGNKAANVKVGNLVSVTGTVDEYQIDGYNDTKRDTDLTVTQINARDDRSGTVNVLENSVELPEPVKITSENLPSEVIDNDSFKEFDPEEDAIDFWESLEGMRVEVDTVKAVAPQEHGDLITVLDDRETDTIYGGVLLTEDNANPDRIQFKMYDNDAARDFEVATGDKFTGPIIGFVNYGFQNYKIYVDLSIMKAKHVKGDTVPETTTIEKADDKLTIASYNLENFSSETSADKAQKLARAFVKDMESPDIIGVTEVQDNNGAKSGDAAADKSYKRLIDFIEAAGGPRYEYLNIDPINNQDGGAPNANIRVGFLYNPDRVSIPEGIPAGNATTAVGYENGSLTHNPGRIDPTNSAFNNSRKPLAAQFNFQGEDVIVIVNHWNSKSGDTPLFGSTQPPYYGSEVKRKQIAKIVYDFVEEIKDDNPYANIVSVGDFNDFQFSEALRIHEGKLMTNMINHVDPSDRYTYLFQGNSQVLDHILVSNNLVDNTEIDILHINSDFTDMAGRASDHDPVMVQVGFADLSNKNFELTVMHTNDTHAALDNMPKTVTAVKDVRAEKPDSLLLHAGDVFTGTLYFNEFHGQADLAFMNLMGFDAMTFGNHEFDLGSSPEGHQALADFIKGAEFPFVSANVDFSNDDKFNGLFNDFITEEIENGQIYNGIIKEVNGEKVGIFGLTTEETVDISSPGSIAFENYLQQAEKAVEAFEAEGVNKIIALTHIGFDDNALVDNDLILAEAVEGIDIIVGGHSHTTLSEPVVVSKDATPTVIVQTGNANSNLGVLDVVFDENGVIIEHAGELIAIGSQKDDQEAAGILAPYKAKVDEVAKEEIGVSTPLELENPRTNGDDTKPSVRKNETILGNLITDGMLIKAREFTGQNVVMALQNGGGIRAAIDAGPITVGEVITVLPFANTLATMEVTGSELKEAFEISLSRYPGENGGFLHVAGGKVEFDSTKPAGERVVEIYIKDANGNFVPVDDNTTYTIATNAFTAKGGDGYDVFAKAYEEGRVTDLGLSDWENFRDHLISVGSEGIPTEIEGRIVDVNSIPNEEPITVVVKPERKGNKYQIDADLLSKVEKEATVIVEISEQKNTIISLNGGAIAKLKEADGNLVISNGVFDLQIPASNLPDGATDIKVKEVKVKDKSALVVYDFTINSMGKDYSFRKEVTLSFTIDSKQVKNPEDVKVLYEAKKAWELVGGNYNEGKITVTTDRLGTFGAFEK